MNPAEEGRRSRASSQTASREEEKNTPLDRFAPAGHFRDLGRRYLRSASDFYWSPSVEPVSVVFFFLCVLLLRLEQIHVSVGEHRNAETARAFVITGENKDPRDPSRRFASCACCFAGSDDPQRRSSRVSTARPTHVDLISERFTSARLEAPRCTKDGRPLALGQAWPRWFRNRCSK